MVLDLFMEKFETAFLVYIFDYYLFLTLYHISLYINYRFLAVIGYSCSYLAVIGYNYNHLAVIGRKCIHYLWLNAAKLFKNVFFDPFWPFVIVTGCRK